MSAAPVFPISAPEPHPAKIPKGRFAKTRPADLAAFSKMGRCEVGIHCKVHAEQIGWGKPWSTRIGIAELATFCNTDPRTVQKAMLKSVDDDGNLKRRKVSGGYEFSRVRPIDSESEEEAWNNCAKCKETTLYVVDRDVPIPHTLFLDVFRGADLGVFLVTLLISLRTLRGKKDGQLWVHPTPISVADFKAATDLEKSEIEADLKTGEALGLFRSAGRRGAIQTYWVTPENWTSIGVRPKRVGGNPSPGRTKSKLTIVEPPQPKQPDRKKPSPPEFLLKPCGVCVKCGTWSVINAVPAPVTPTKKPVGQARAGPVTAPGEFWQAPWDKKSNQS
jgi:hypothetical protein